MAKFCSKCGNELVDNAAMCVKCGTMVDNNNKGNKKKGLPTWAIILIVVGCVILIPIIIFVVIGIVGYNYIKDNDINIKDYVDNIVTPHGTIGDTLSNDEVKITLTNALTYSYIDGDVVNTPNDGKEYLVFFFEVENISDEVVNIFSYDFSGYADDVSVKREVLFNDVDGYEELGTDLAVGKKTTGYIAFEVDTNWKNFEVHYNSDLFGYDDSMVFEVVNDNNSSKQSGV